jgi:hypothetical protein
MLQHMLLRIIDPFIPLTVLMEKICAEFLQITGKAHPGFIDPLLQFHSLPPDALCIPDMQKRFVQSFKTARHLLHLLFFGQVVD